MTLLRISVGVLICGYSTVFKSCRIYNICIKFCSIFLSHAVYTAGESSFEMRREADSNDISAECSHDDQPTVIGTGMLVCCVSNVNVNVM